MYVCMHLCMYARTFTCLYECIYVAYLLWRVLVPLDSLPATLLFPPVFFDLNHWIGCDCQALSSTWGSVEWKYGCVCVCVCVLCGYKHVSHSALFSLLVAKTHGMPHLYRSFFAEEPYYYWLFCEKWPATGRAASPGGVARHRGRTRTLWLVYPRSQNPLTADGVS